MTFDTLSVATELKQAGFSPEQAEALARAWSHVASGDLATKADVMAVKLDLEKTRSELKEEISSVRAELKEDIAAVRADLTDIRGDIKTLRWMFGFGLGLGVLVLGKLFLLHV